MMKMTGGDTMVGDKFWDCIKGDDMDFYEEFLVNLSEEELQRFLDENPDFLRE